MTDNEIIKALERCPQHTECCYCNSLEECGNKKVLATSTLDLINRQRAEIERLQKLQNPTETSGFRIENGKVIFYSDMLNGYRHEYKDLDEIVKELNLYMHTDYKNIELISHYKHKAQTAKSEAIKEFAERICEGRVSNDPVVIAVRNELECMEYED